MQVAFLIDGGFLEKSFKSKTKLYLKPEEVRTICDKAMLDPEFKDDQLFRIYYYDCEPFSGTVAHPLTGAMVDFSTTKVYEGKLNFLKNLKLMPRVALRAGTLSHNGWKIPYAKIKEVIEKTKTGISLEEKDLVINLSQKKVDIKIGLDMAWLSSKRIIEKIVIITGDSDFVPAMKMARKEGVMVFLVHFDHKVKEELKEHCDGIVDVNLRSIRCGHAH